MKRQSRPLAAVHCYSMLGTYQFDTFEVGNLWQADLRNNLEYMDIYEVHRLIRIEMSSTSLVFNLGLVLI